VTNSAREYVPPGIVAQTMREKVFVGDKTFLIDRPANGDDLIDHPAIKTAFSKNEFLPHWVDLWPAARMLAKAVLAENWPQGLRCLEIGCGLGLAGIAALSKSLKVTFSDYDTTAVNFAARNARLNGFRDFAMCPFDWHDPPNVQFPLVIGSDLTYKERNHEPLFQAFSKLLDPGGLILLTDPDRKQTPAFFDIVRARGWHYSRKVMHAGAPAKDRMRGTLYRITHPSHTPS